MKTGTEKNAQRKKNAREKSIDVLLDENNLYIEIALHEICECRHRAMTDASYQAFLDPYHPNASTKALIRLNLAVLLEAKAAVMRRNGQVRTVWGVSEKYLSFFPPFGF